MQILENEEAFGEYTEIINDHTFKSFTEKLQALKQLNEDIKNRAEYDKTIKETTKKL